jgi:hypothetical protein
MSIYLEGLLSYEYISGGVNCLMSIYLEGLLSYEYISGGTTVL